MSNSLAKTSPGSQRDRPGQVSVGTQYDPPVSEELRQWLAQPVGSPSAPGGVIPAEAAAVAAPGAVLVDDVVADAPGSPPSSDSAMSDGPPSLVSSCETVYGQEDETKADENAEGAAAIPEGSDPVEVEIDLRPGGPEVFPECADLVDASEDAPPVRQLAAAMPLDDPQYPVDPRHQRQLDAITAGAQALDLQNAGLLPPLKDFLSDHTHGASAQLPTPLFPKREFKRGSFREGVDVPLRYRGYYDNWGRFCGFCGSKWHPWADCGPVKYKSRRYGEDRATWKGLDCKYPICSAPATHETKVCPTLHNLCYVCNKRGHDTEECGTLDKEEYKELYELWQPQGKFTRQGISSPEPDWKFSGPPVAALDLTQVEVDGRSAYVPWTAEEVERFDGLSLEEKKREINKEMSRFTKV